MRNLVYLFVFDGFVDSEAALALCEIRRPGDFRVRTVGLDRCPVQSMAGLTVLPDVALDEIESDNVALIILPGGSLWERRTMPGVVAALRLLHASGAIIGALSTGVLPVASARLLDRRKHTGHYAGHIEAFVAEYRGAELYEATALAVTDDAIVTAGGANQVEFAHEIIRALGLYDERDTATWYRLFKYGCPLPQFTSACARHVAVISG